MAITIITLTLTVAMFIWGKWRSDVTAVAALCVLMLTGRAFAFGSPGRICFTGCYNDGGAICRWRCIVADRPGT